MLLALVFLFNLVTNPLPQVIDDDPEPIHSVMMVDDVAS